MRKSNKDFNNGLISLLHNMSGHENNNQDLNNDQIFYYRGILLACVQLIMKFYDADYFYAMKRIYEFCPLDSYNIIRASLPESWVKDWENLTGIARN